MTGNDCRRLSRRNKVTNSIPSIRGMSMSVISKSKSSLRKAFQPSMPSTATATS
ncbi:hypothetical protein D3C84_1232740 [compost metagenome]